MHPLLERQIRKHLAGQPMDTAAGQAFLAAISAAYDEAEADKRHMDHVLEVTSEELTEANERIRREAQDELASLNRRFEQILEIHQGMILCVRRTPQGFQHTLCRGQLRAHLGLSATEIEGRLVEEVAPPPQAAQLNAAYERAWQGEELTLEFTTSENVELLLQLRPRRVAAATVELIVSCTEIGALKETARELRLAKERAESADRAKSEFLAVVSHEIRTPLNAILGFSQLLAQSPLTPDQRGWIATLQGGGTALHELIGDILDFSRLEAGKLELWFESADPREIAESAVGLMRERAARKNLTLRLTLDPELPSLAVIDAARLRQILLNLLGNAVKFTAQGEVHLTARLASRTGDDCLLEFQITDTGIGIPPEARERLFKPFAQADSSTTRTFGGTGLGLAICRRLVRAMGGEIDYTSEPGRGTCFTFTLSAHVERPAPPPEAPVVRSPVPPGLRILVAEDEPTNRALMDVALACHRCIVDFATNGRDAVEQARRKTYDVILLDLLMPGLDGWEVARQIRATCTPCPPLIALTASTLPQLAERCRAAGIDSLLTKPVDLSALASELARIPAPTALS